MPRPRKAQVNQVIMIHATGAYGVIVDYRDDRQTYRYRAVRTDKVGRNPRGQAIWLDAPDFAILRGRTVKRPGVVYRANEKAGGDLSRGCACQCCAHIRGYEEEPE